MSTARARMRSVIADQVRESLRNRCGGLWRRHRISSWWKQLERRVDSLTEKLFSNCSCDNLGEERRNRIPDLALSGSPAADHVHIIRERLEPAELRGHSIGGCTSETAPQPDLVAPELSTTAGSLRA